VITSIYVENLRGVKRCVVNNLTHVNIFIGRNGAGKSTLLEAIYMASAWARPLDIIKGVSKFLYVVTRRRGHVDARYGWEIYSKYKDMLWFNKYINEEIQIALNFGEKKMEFRLMYSQPQPPHAPPADGPALWLVVAQGSNVIYYQRPDSFWSPVTKSTPPLPFSELQKRVEDELRQELEFLEGVLLLDSRLTPRDLEQRIWPQLLDRRLDTLIVEMLREEYEVDVHDITYKPVGGEYVLALKLKNTTVEIDALGDGARAAVMYASPLALVKDTAVLMEDPEAHQHPAGLKAFMSFALKIAKRQNLQLFITTHSIELINIIKQLVRELDMGIHVYFMERGPDGVVDVRMLEEVDVDVLQKMGLDPRLLYLV
jgi:energy-coupling factor transporter ATP-binding protein EcfA2